MNLAAIDYELAQAGYERNEMQVVKQPIIPLMIGKLNKMTSDLEDMVAELKAAYRYDTDSSFHYAMLDLDKVHSKLLAILDDMKGEIR